MTAAALVPAVERRATECAYPPLPPARSLPQVEVLLGPKTEADLVKPDKKKKPAKPAENGGAAAKAPGGAAAAAAKKAEEEAWRTADPYAFLPKPAANNMVHTTVHFRCGALCMLRCAGQDRE